MSADKAPGSQAAEKQFLARDPFEPHTAEEAAELAAAVAALQADPEFSDRLRQAQAALCAGFLPWLEQAFPERWAPTGWTVQNNEEVCADIEYVSGYSLDLLCAERQPSYAAQKHAFDAFAQEHFRRPEQQPAGDRGVFCFHGSSRESVEAIHDGGFDAARWKEGVYGNGGYVSTLLSVALAYAALDDAGPQAAAGPQADTGRLWAAYGRAHLGDPADIPVGTRGQTDFGAREDGTPHMTLTNPVRTYYCLRDPRQFLASGFMAFKVRFDQRPSDFALRHMVYHPAVWRKMTERLPGLVAYKQNLLKAANTEREERQRRRQERKRLADFHEGDGDAGGAGGSAAGGSAARRSRGA